MVGTRRGSRRGRAIAVREAPRQGTGLRVVGVLTQVCENAELAGLVAATRICATHPSTAVLVLGQYVDPRFAHRLLADQPAGAGYLLKERVSNISVLVDALHRITEGECVLDPTIVSRLLSRRRPASKLARLTEREHDVLQLLAEGRSNSAIAAHLFIAERTVESACASIFRKLELEHSTDVNRRVLAVVELMRGT